MGCANYDAAHLAALRAVFGAGWKPVDSCNPADNIGGIPFGGTSPVAGAVTGAGVIAFKMPGGAVQSVTDNTFFASAIAVGGIPIRADGSNFDVTMFGGGYLLDGCPLNVVFGTGWLAGQQDALRAAGLTRCLGGSGSATGCQSGICGPVIKSGAGAGSAVGNGTQGAGATSGTQGQTAGVTFDWKAFFTGPFGLLILLLLIIILAVTHRKGG